MNANGNLLDLIEKHWGFRELRPLQGPAIDAMMARRDSLVVLPTGGGKSLCYQAPAVALSLRGEGPTVVVSPLISLMKDQVDSLRSNGIAAAQLDSTLGADERRQVTDELRAGRLDLLFVSPERLVMPAFQDFLRELGVRTFAIDEAHCISHWGHDFRPEYRQMAMLKEVFPGCNVHAFTATATERVREDIVAQLKLDDPAVLVGNFDRPNLTYRILPRQELMKQVVEVLDRHKDEAGIVYCLRRRDVDDYVKTLNGLGRHALGYHAGMTGEQRHKSQDAFLQEKCDLIVATVAFGMGIDRSNIRFVIHAGMPKSIEAYQQETGRAGRDGLEAECVLFYSGADLFSWKRLIEKSVAEAKEAGTEVAADFVASSMMHIEAMDRYCRSAVCRHKALVEHFGQTYEAPGRGADDADGDGESKIGCGACDHCLGDTQEIPDATVLAQKILSAVARTGERFGIGHVMAVLRGSERERVLQLGHNKLSVYGLLKGHEDRELRDFIYQLIGQGVLAQESVEIHSGTTASILKLNAGSWEVMKGKRTVRLVQPVRGAKKPEKRKDAASWEGVDEALFEKLRELRRALAGAQNVPPYVIFSDNTLRDLARQRPSSPQNMRLVYGIGERKMKDFADRVLPLIAAHCRQSGAALDQRSGFERAAVAPRPVSKMSDPKRQAYVMFEKGAAVDEVSAAVGRARATVSEYLAEWVETERPETVAAWVPDAVYARVKAAAEKRGTRALRPIFMELDETVPYDVIRWVVAHLRALESVKRA